MANLYILKTKIEGIGNEDKERKLRQALKDVKEIKQIDVNRGKNLVRIISEEPVSLSVVRELIVSLGLRPDEVKNIMDVKIGGMHCRSCEITIERNFKKLKGVQDVTVDLDRGTARIVAENGNFPSVSELRESIKEDGYSIGCKVDADYITDDSKKPGFFELVGLFAVVLFLAFLFSKLGLLNIQPQIGEKMSFAAAFVIGLVAASSSCLAVSGGLLLSVSARFRARYYDGRASKAMKPVWYFVIGRVLSYGFFGGVIGFIGKALSPSPFVTGLITIAAAAFMLIMGLDMLHIAPAWLKRLLPKTSKSLNRKIVSMETHDHPLAPALLGAATFFLPCGFTQALQLYVLTTANAATGALILFAFALGTAPALLALGYASNSFKGKVGEYFFKFAGALVIIMGIWNIQNGLTLMDVASGLGQIGSSRGAVAAEGTNTTDPDVRYNGRDQTVSINVSSAGYNPSSFTLRRGVPTKLLISGPSAGRGCLSGFQIPKLRISELLNVGGVTTIEFTPSASGTYGFSCSMGMYRGRFVVR